MKKYADMKERLIANSYLSEESYFEGTPCWEWVGARTRNNYPKINIRVNGKHKQFMAHRISFETFNKKIRSNVKEVNHKCGNTLCVNPLHLELVTPKQNCRYREMMKKIRQQHATP